MNRTITFSLACFFILSACSTVDSKSNTSPSITVTKTINTSEGIFIVPGEAFLDGRDLESKPPITLLNINIWSTVSRQKTSCRLQHGTKVQLTDATYKADESREYFKIKNGSCEGWLPETFLSLIYHAPAGDLMP